MMPVFVAFLISLILGSMRLYGIKSEMFQGIAHVCVGGMFGAWLIGCLLPRYNGLRFSVEDKDTILDGLRQVNQIVGFDELRILLLDLKSTTQWLGLFAVSLTVVEILCAFVIYPAKL